MCRLYRVEPVGCDAADGHRAIADARPAPASQPAPQPIPQAPKPSSLPAGLNVLFIGDSNTEIGHITGDDTGFSRY